MGFCKVENQTLSVFTINDQYLLGIRNTNQLTGILGRCMDRLLCESRKRKCEIVSTSKLGTKQGNGS